MGGEYKDGGGGSLEFKFLVRALSLSSLTRQGLARMALFSVKLYSFQDPTLIHGQNILFLLSLDKHSLTDIF
jgi:hypothetical protein